MSIAHKRRWYQFSLRSLLVVITTLCLVPGGYVAHEQRKAGEQKAKVKSLEALGAFVRREPRTPPRSPLMRAVLGDESFAHVTLVAMDNKGSVAVDAGLVDVAKLNGLVDLSLVRSQVTTSAMKKVAGLENLKVLRLDETQMTDARLRHVGALVNLESLSVNNYLKNTQLTDEGLATLASLRNLQKLSLNNTQVTNAGLREICILKALKSLSLENTLVTDDGLVDLSGLANLQYLNLHNTQATTAGVAKLQKALPNCRIVHR